MSSHTDVSGRSGDLPNTSTPNSSKDLYVNGELYQRRYYDASGNMIKDIDFLHNNTGAALLTSYLVKKGMSIIDDALKNNKYQSWYDNMDADQQAYRDLVDQQIQDGWTAEERYNYQVYGDKKGADAYPINVTDSHTVLPEGTANTVTRKIDENGNLLQDRIYGDYRRAIVDIDYFHNEKPGTHIFPHEHWFDWSEGYPNRSK